MTDFISLSCPNCGGQISILGGTARAKCPYCGTQHLISEEAARRVEQEYRLVCPVCKKDDRVEKVSAIVARDMVGSPSILGQILTLDEPDFFELQKPIPPTWTTERTALPSPSDSQQPAKKQSWGIYIVGGAIALWFLSTLVLLLSSANSRTDQMVFSAVFALVIFLIASLRMVWAKYLASPPNMVEVILVTLVVLGFAVFVLFLIFTSQEFSWLLSLFAVGLAWAGVRYFFKQFPIAQQRTADKVGLFSPKNSELSSKANSQVPVYQAQMETYRSQLGKYEQHRLANRLSSKQQAERMVIWNELFYCGRNDIVFLPDENVYVSSKEIKKFIDLQWNYRFNQAGK